mgnify:CR=1 FL=1
MSAHCSAALSSPRHRAMPARRAVCALLVALGCGAARGADDGDALSRKMPPFRLTLANQMTDELPLKLQLSGGLAALSVSERSVVVLGFSYAALLQAASFSRKSKEQ